MKNKKPNGRKGKEMQEFKSFSYTKKQLFQATEQPAFHCLNATAFASFD
jgi:hypothetical protein